MELVFLVTTAVWFFSIVLSFSMNLSHIMREHGRHMAALGITLFFMLLFSFAAGTAVARIFFLLSEQ